MSDNVSPSTSAAIVQKGSPKRWTGLGHWNFYFLIKLLLYWSGHLQFNVYYNCLFAAALVFPLGNGWVNRIRHIVAIPFGIALLYHDSWYPPISRLLAQPEVLDFSFWYLIELLERFINWQLVGAGFIALVVYLYIYQWVRLTTVNILILVGIALHQYVTLPAWLTQPVATLVAQTQQQQAFAVNTVPAATAGTQANPNSPQTGAVTQPVVAGKPTDDVLNAYLENFYRTESSRKVQFPSSVQGAPFDVILVSICSLAWSDLTEVDMSLNPLLDRMNVVFDDFSSVSSYSGPAVLRLLRANCGQTPHPDLYKPADSACYLFQTLSTLGYKTEAALNHDGKFQGFLSEIRTNGNLPEPYIPTQTRPSLTSFDGSPIWDDYTTLQGWWQRRLKESPERVALLYNTITLHDGNREATADGGGRTAPYRPRAERLIAGLEQFLNDLEKSGRKVLVVFIPEHGAALKADKMQIAGMREVPTYDITHVPVGVRVIGAADKAQVSPVHVTGQTSFLALSDLIRRILENNVFEQAHINWNALIDGLPTTEHINENDGTIVMRYGNEPYIRLGGLNWIEYPR